MRSSSNGGEVKRFNGGDMMSISTIRSETNLKPEMKTVKITPIKSPVEINNALRRQRRVSGVRYTTTTAAAAAAPGQTRPTYRAVLPVAFQPNFTQCTITTSHSMTGEPAAGVGGGGGESSFIVTRITDEKGRKETAVHQEKMVIRNMGGASIKDPGGGLRANGSKTAIPTLNSVKMTSPRNSVDVSADGGLVKSQHAYWPNWFHGQGYNGLWTRKDDVQLPVSRTLPPGYRLNDTFTQDNNPFGFSRSLTSDRITRHNPGGPAVREISYNDDLLLPGQRVYREDSSLLTQGRRGQIHLNPSPSQWFYDSRDSPRGGVIRMTPHLQDNSQPIPGKDARDSAAFPETAPSQNTRKLPELSSLDLADSIIRAVKEDISEVYNLCQTRVKYSDFIEKTQPHRLWDRAALGESSENKRGESVSSEPSPRSAVLPKSTTALPNKTSLFSKLRSNQVASSSAIPPLDSDFARSTPNPHREREAITEVEVVSIPAPPEPEIDYDKPITIIIESDQDGSLKSTRPILKQTNKLNGVSLNSEKTKTGDCNNNHNKLTHLPTGLGTQPERVELTAVVISQQGKTQSQHEQVVTTANRDKGRLVRFNIDPKIHEFTPSDPVLSPK